MISDNFKSTFADVSVRRVCQRAMALLFLGLLGGCSNGQGGPPRLEGGPVRVVATTTMIADAVRRVGGEHVQVDCLMGAGIDPHTFKPSAGDIGKLEAAHLVLYNGLHLEGKMADVFEHGAKTGTMRATAVAKGVPHDKLRTAEEGFEGSHDPHVWFDVTLWKAAVAQVRDELAALDPPHNADYVLNAANYALELDRLDREVREKVGTLSPDRRVLVTSHDAFGYFGRAYGFEVRGLQGVSTASETGTKDVQELAAFLGSRKVPAVFTETSVPAKGLEKVLDTVKRDYGHTVRLVGGADALYSDSLGDPGTPGDTYVGMVRHNVAVIVGALSK